MTTPHNKRAGRLPKWAKKESDLGIATQWPEGWRAWHVHGLELVVLSGCVTTRLFTEQPSTDILAKLPMLDSDVRWLYRVAGGLLAGVGVEVLLKAAYLKAGYTIRDPAGQHLAKRDSPEARLLNPRKTATFGSLLRDENLSLICADPKSYKPLTVAKWLRDDTAHSASTVFVHAHVHLVQFCLALKALHTNLMDGADDAHVLDIQRAIAQTDSIRVLRSDPRS